MEKNLTRIIFVIFYVLLAFSQFSICSYVFVEFCWLLLGATALLCSLTYYSIERYKSVLFFMLIYTMCGLTSCLYNGNADIQEMLWPIAFMGLGIFFMSTSSLERRFCIIVNICFMLFMFFSLYYYHSTNAMIGNIRSLNGVNVALLLAISIFSYTSNSTSKSILPELVMCVVAFIISLSTVGISGGGRSGVIIFIFLTVSIALIGINNCSNKTRSLTLFIFIILMSLLIFLINAGFSENIINLQNRGLKSQRYNIWKDYIELVLYGNIFDCIFGASFANATTLLTRYSTNLHNSFLMLHAKYGMFMLIIVIILQINSIYFFYKHKKNIILLFVLAWIIRMSVDYCNFNSILDILFVIYIFTPFDKYNRYHIGCKKISQQINNFNARGENKNV